MSKRKSAFVHLDVREALDFVRLQLIACQEHLRVFDELTEALKNDLDREALDVAPGFFHLTILAHRDALRLHLVRLLDTTEAAKKHGSISIFRILELAALQPSAFRSRTRDQIDRMIHGDKRRLNSLSKKTQRLSVLRNLLVAHNDPRQIMDPGAVRRAAVNVSGYRAVLAKLKPIVRRYLRAIDGRSHPWRVENADHVSQLVEWIRIGLEARYGTDEEEPKQVEKPG